MPDKTPKTPTAMHKLRRAHRSAVRGGHTTLSLKQWAAANDQEQVIVDAHKNANPKPKYKAKTYKTGAGGARPKSSGGSKVKKVKKVTSEEE